MSLCAGVPLISKGETEESICCFVPERALTVSFERTGTLVPDKGSGCFCGKGSQVGQDEIGNRLSNQGRRRGRLEEQLSEIASLQVNTAHRGARIATRKSQVVIALATLSLSGIAVLLFITRWGVGLSYDSVSYIAIARDLLNGRGYPTALWFYRTTHWPPLLPLVLAAIGTLRIDPLIGARWLNTGLFAANIALVGAIVNRYGGLFWPSVLASYVILASPTTLMIHAMAWSEPLFIFLGFLGILLLADYIDRRVPVLLFASASAVAGAFLTRYVGGALVVAGALGLLLLTAKPLRTRLIDAAIFVAVSSLPTLLWMLRNG